MQVSPKYKKGTVLVCTHGKFQGLIGEVETSTITNSNTFCYKIVNIHARVVENGKSMYVPVKFVGAYKSSSGKPAETHVIEATKENVERYSHFNANTMLPCGEKVEYPFAGAISKTPVEPVNLGGNNSVIFITKTGKEMDFLTLMDRLADVGRIEVTAVIR
ncbi:hypothetical protein OPFAMLBM_00305 [Aeromonas phage avDM12-TAAL]|nr:hypothetical protein OPFAMLBM_00305 [Aeromonas phage avDM12-TAAL]